MKGSAMGMRGVRGRAWVRRSLRGLLAASLVLAAPAAQAAVSEPDGTTVPKASSDVTQLNTFFAQQGEPIDWLADAASTPNAFSPLCGFSATFLLHGADCPLDFAWYNETGQPPSASDLHTIIPAYAPVGTSFTGTDIKNDPAYLGGLVGFALVGSFSQFCTQTHYSNPKWNQNCSGCNPQASWITTLIYPSKKTPSAFYLAFEDGPTSTFSFNNDGDFNDDVYFISGVTCVGGGQPCDTQKLGICASGITQCTATGTVCQDLSPPAQEKCNGLDDDCNGQTDEGDICPAGRICDKGKCVESCHGGEFTCPPATVCSEDGHCVDPLCKDVMCDAGLVCIDGKCKGPCDEVVCPFGQVCRVGVCLDPCAGITCGSGQVCDGGVCVNRCDCLPCAAGKTCVPSTGLCIEAACAGVNCAGGKHCEKGNCVGPCDGVVCPMGQACNAGQCTETQGGTGGGGSVTGVGVGVGGSETTASGSGGSGGHGGATGGSGGGFGGGGNGQSSSCGCRVAGDPSSDVPALLGAALALSVMGRRRRARKG
ncbi:Type IV fimbrial biogenesis protein PilY1 [Minicystis rosea]|nr:Type IV fimbrial biogenesis protein PilY1 [Minicystis rosea]